MSGGGGEGGEVKKYLISQTTSFWKQVIPDRVAIQYFDAREVENVTKGSPIEISSLANNNLSTPGTDLSILFLYGPEV